MKVQLVAKDSHPVVQMQDGAYHSGSDTASPDYADARIDADHIALGDLNGDGNGDAAVLLAETYGGSGVFVSLVAVLNSGGQPVDAGAVSIDDRPSITGLAIQNGQIVLNAKIHGPNDPGCCAAQPVTDAYGLMRNGPVLLSRASKAPDGTERVLRIDSPANGDQVPAAPLQVKGTYTATPFEDVLTYRVFDEQRNTLAAGPLFAGPASSGGGVVFDGTIDMTGLQTNQSIRLEIVDFNPDDRSIVAMDSIQLVIK